MIALIGPGFHRIFHGSRRASGWNESTLASALSVARACKVGAQAKGDRRSMHAAWRGSGLRYVAPALTLC